MGDEQPPPELAEELIDEFIESLRFDVYSSHFGHLTFKSGVENDITNASKDSAQLLHLYLYMGINEPHYFFCLILPFVEQLSELLLFGAQPLTPFDANHRFIQIQPNINKPNFIQSSIKRNAF